VQLDGRSLHNGDTVELSSGAHTLQQTARGRLYWQPPKAITAMLDPRFKKRGELIGVGHNR
jgi:hypothetical protein